MNNLDRYAVKYQIPCFDQLFEEYDDINIKREAVRATLFVEYRGDNLWAVVDAMGNASDKDGDMFHEPMPSHRRQDWLSRYRFSKEEAFRVAARALPEHVGQQILRQAHDKIQLAKNNIPNSEQLVAFYERIIDLVERAVEQVRREFLDTAD